MEKDAEKDVPSVSIESLDDISEPLDKPIEKEAEKEIKDAVEEPEPEKTEDNPPPIQEIAESAVEEKAAEGLDR